MTRYPPGEAERVLAGALVAEVQTRAPQLLLVNGIDLASALEHALFTVLRQEATGSAEAPMAQLRAASAALTLLRIARAGVLAPMRRVDASIGGVLFVVSASIHVRLASLVAVELQRRAGPAVHLVTTQREFDPSGPFASSGVLGDHLAGRWLPSLVRHALALHSQYARATDGWELLDAGRAPALRHLLTSTLPRLALRAAELDSTVARLDPSVVIAFNESGIWGRLVPAVAHTRGLPALDLPHAEAADPWATVGIGYDMIGVYGSRARAVMEAAGIEAERIAEVGPLRYDPLIRALANVATTPALPKRIVFASQPAGPGRAMKTSEKAETLRVAIAACAEAVPCELLICPHPTETDRVADTLLAESVLPDGVAAKIDAAHDLHEMLPGAWLLLTASSQSTYEAAIAGVPSVTIHVAPGPETVTFAREGIALGVRDEATAREAVRRLSDDAQRQQAVSRARAALARHVGALDGRAAERIAVLVDRLGAK